MITDEPCIHETTGCSCYTEDLRALVIKMRSVTETTVAEIIQGEIPGRSIRRIVYSQQLVEIPFRANLGSIDVVI